MLFCTHIAAHITPFSWSAQHRNNTFMICKNSTYEKYCSSICNVEKLKQKNELDLWYIKKIYQQTNTNTHAQDELKIG